MAKKFFIIFLFFAALGLFSATLIKAATDTSIITQPSSIEISASPGQKLARTFSVINRSNYYVKFKVVVKDYRQSSENGNLEFYDNKIDPASEWLIPQYLEIGLKPLESKDVGIVVNIPKEFGGGGHYGAVLFQSEGGAAVDNNNFGTLVLLNITGANIAPSAIAKTVSFGTTPFQQGNPVDFKFRVQNVGNTHFETQGKLVLKNWLGKEIGNYNIGQMTIYPKTVRLFTWRWNSTSRLGIYKAEVWLADSSNKSKLADGAWFILFPWPVALISLAAIALLMIFVRFRKYILSRRLYKWVSEVRGRQKNNFDVKSTLMKN